MFRGKSLFVAVLLLVAAGAGCAEDGMNVGRDVDACMRCADSKHISFSNLRTNREGDGATVCGKVCRVRRCGRRLCGHVRVEITDGNGDRLFSEVCPLLPCRGSRNSRASSRFRVHVPFVPPPDATIRVSYH